VVAEDWLATMCTALERHAFVAGRFEGERLNSRRARRSRPLDQQDGLQSSAGSPPHAGAGNLGVHRKVFRAVGGFDPTVTVLEDTDLCWRIQRTGVPLVYVPDLVVHVRLRATLGAMYRQGVAYGRAHARLERRHAEAMSDSSAASPPASSLDPGDDPAAPTQRSRGRLEGWVGSPPSMARFVWQIGWHRGHRQGPDERPDPQAGTVAGRHRSNDDPE